jgi:hypothetical protein
MGTATNTAASSGVVGVVGSALFRYFAPARLSRAERERLFVAVADGRRSIATVIDGLNPNQLATEGPGFGWDVRTVAAHFLAISLMDSGASRPAAIVTAPIGESTRWPVAARASADEIAETLRRRALKGSVRR